MALINVRWNSIKTRITAAMLGIFLAGIWSLSFYAQQTLRLDMERLLGEQQFSAASFMAEEVNQGLDERISALELTARSIDPHMMVSPLLVKDFLDQKIILKTFFNAGVHVVGRDGVVLAGVFDVSGRINPINTINIISAKDMDHATIQTVLSEGKTLIGRPLISPLLKQPLFCIVTAIFDAQGQIIGALVGTTNLGQPNFLDKISASKNSKTGQYQLLIAPQYRLIVTASNKKRVLEMLPGLGINPPIDRFIQGYEGSAMMVNPSGVDVLSTAKSVPVAGWFVIISLPEADAFAPIRRMQRRLLWATIFLTILAGGLIYWILKRQLSPLLNAATALSTMSSTNQRPQPLPVGKPDEIGKLICSVNQLLATLGNREDALRLSEQKLSNILQNVDANIYLKDTGGRYLFVNRSVCKVFGASIEQIVGQTDEAFFDAETVMQLHLNDRAVLQEGKTFRQEEHVVNFKEGFASTYMSVKLPLHNEAGEIYALCGISTDITERKKIEQELRIAAIAFDCQEGIVVMDVDMVIIKVNQACSKITGYAQHELQGKKSSVFRSERQALGIYPEVENDLKKTGTWNGEMWRRRKNGEDYFVKGAIAAVRNEQDQVTHYVINFTDITDITDRQQQEQQRLLNELAHRDVLVREVHHRIKNNLQGITGLLRQFAQKYPAIADPANQAISQVQSISVIYGLRGRTDSLVLLSELTIAIADEIQALWQTPVTVDSSAFSLSCIIAENEAVPIALILNELILNAVKHGGKTHGGVTIRLKKGASPHVVQVDIVNAGQLSSGGMLETVHHSGLQLVAALMPRTGASLSSAQQADQVITTLVLGTGIISIDKKEFT